MRKLQLNVFVVAETLIWVRICNNAIDDYSSGPKLAAKYSKALQRAESNTSELIFVSFCKKCVISSTGQYSIAVLDLTDTF